MTERTESRRGFLKTAALLGGSAAAATQAPGLLARFTTAEAGGYLTPDGEYRLAKPEHILYSVCQQCNTQCGIKVKIDNGVIAKIDGNPYSPWNMMPHVPYKTPVTQTATVDGLLCPKGQAAIQTVYDPYRLVKVLKRAGKRGEGKWVSVPFAQAVTEIVEGGLLFKDVPGEEGRKVEGLGAIWAIRDPKVLKALAADARKVAKKELTVAEFKTKHHEYLDRLIDPDHPDLGPKNNQLVFMWGRVKGGRGDVIRRFTEAGLGSTNAHGHTTVCQGSLYFTGKAMSEQYVYDDNDKKMKWTKGQKFYWQADQQAAEFILFVGASPLEGNYGPTNRGSRIAQRVADGDLKIAVVDPRASKTAAKAWKWVPIKPGAESALAFGMIRWVLDHERYDARYLANANKAAAKADGEPTWSNATWLVKIEKGQPGAFLRASEIGLPKERRVHKDDKTGEETAYEFDPFVVLKGGQPVPFDPYSEKTAAEGDLFVATDVKRIPVKSGLQILKDAVTAKSLAEWAAVADIRPQDVVELAREFTSHGKRAVVDIHRGVSQHTNGFYQVLAWYSLNLLIGNYDWKGGLAKASTYDPSGGKTAKTKGPDGSEVEWKQPFPVKAAGALNPFGISLIRHGDKYEETTVFAGYPAKRPWYTLASDVYQEIIPSIGDAYPYPIKALFIYMGSPVYALPAGHTSIEVLADPNKIPLVVANDIVIGETSMYADYIFPDLTNLERWEFAGSHPNMVWKVQPVRQPVIAPIPETVKVYGQDMPIGLESMCLAMAEKLGLPGFGPDGFGAGKPFTHPDHLYLRMVANLAAGEKPDQALPDASPEEVRIFLEGRKHLPKSVFDPERWQAIVGKAWWPKVVYLLNRGGRFDDFAKGYDGDLLKNKYGTLINLYQEKTAKTKDSMTGKPLPGSATYLPSPLDALGRTLDDERAGYDLRLITYREIAATKSRTAANYWLLALRPENFVLMNRRDAVRRGLRDGDQVRVHSASNPDGVWDFKNGSSRPIVGKVKVIQGIRPGVIAFSLGHGHWAYGASDVVIDGQVVKGDKRRGAGIHANAALRIDPVLKNTTLSDLVGGSAVFYDTQVKVTKA